MKRTEKVKKMADITLNAIGKMCPMPVLMTKKELKKMSSGQILEVIASDKGAIKDIPAMLRKIGDELLETKDDGDNIIFVIKKN